MSAGDGFEPRDHVSELETHEPMTDCTFTAMLETLRFGFPDGQLIPTDHDEWEAYRRDSGLATGPGGGTIPQAVTGARKRYGMTGGYVVPDGWLQIRAALVAGKLLVVQGNMQHVSAHLRRFTGPGTVGHAVAARGLTWCDPMAPVGTYVGEPVGIATWQAFFTGLRGARAFITDVGGLTRGASMAGDYVVYEPPKTGQPKAGAPFYNDRELSDQRGHMGDKPGRINVRGYRGNCWAVEVRTGQGWDDKVPRQTNVFMAKDDVTAIRDAPPATGDRKHDVQITVDGQPKGAVVEV